MTDAAAHADGSASAVLGRQKRVDIAQGHSLVTLKHCQMHTTPKPFTSYMVPDYILLPGVRFEL